MATVFVGRDVNSKIITVAGVSQPGAAEAISSADTGVIAFLTQSNIIPFSTFIGRWTVAEYAKLLQARAAAVTAGSVSMMQQYDIFNALNQIDLNNPLVSTMKAQIVTAAILTQARADVIFS